MRINEIENELPNGFHDSIIKRINIDYISKTTEITIDVYIKPGILKTGILHLIGLSFISIDPPETGYPYLDNKGLWISGCDSLTHELRNKIPQDLKDSDFTYYFFINEWNAFVIFAASDAQFEWDKE